VTPAPEGAVLESFLMSCRVIGRGIETALLCWVADWCRAKGYARLAGDFVPSAKNSVAGRFYPEHGFAGAEPLPGGGRRAWLDLSGTRPSWPGHVSRRP